MAAKNGPFFKYSSVPYDLLHVLNCSCITRCYVFKVRVAAEIFHSSDCDGRCLAAPSRLARQPPPAHTWPLSLYLRTRGLHSLRWSFSWSENIRCQHPFTLAIRNSKVLFLNPGMKSEDQCSRTWCLLFHQWFCCFSSTCFVKCKVRPALCLCFNRPALADFLQGALLTVICMSESLSQLAEWRVCVQISMQSVPWFFGFPYRMSSSVLRCWYLRSQRVKLFVHKQWNEMSEQVRKGKGSDILWLLKVYCNVHCLKSLIDTLLQFIYVSCYINGMHHLQPTPPSSRPIQQPPVTSRPLVEKQQTGELSLCSVSGLNRSVCKTSASLTAQTISIMYCPVEYLSGSFSSCKRGVMHFCVFLGSFTTFVERKLFNQPPYLESVPMMVDYF